MIELDETARTLLIWGAALGFLFGPDDHIAGAAKVIACAALLIIAAVGRVPW